MVKKILIIEDDPTALRLTEYTLKQHGYQVLTTYNGLEGIITAQKEEPDLIILDIMLPGIDGYEVCNRLRSGAQTAQIPILIISGKAQEEDIAAGFRAGANDYLTKPATPSDIICRVEHLLDEKPSNRSNIITFLNSDYALGITMILANLAAAISELGKQVTLVDIVNRDVRSTNKAEAFSRGTSDVILETDSISNGNREPALEVLPSGIRMLHINEASEHEDTISDDSIELLQKVGNNNDYLLIDLPFKPTAFIRSTLSNSDLIIITSDYKLNDLCEIQNTVTSISFLGIAPKRLATLLIDPKGTFPGLSSGSLKPFIEANLGIALAGTISLDAKLYQLTYLDSPPIIQSSPGSQLANSIRQIAQYILAHGYTKQQPYQSVVKTSYLEKS